MIIKIFWYICSVSTILLILVTTPKGVSIGSTISQNKNMSFGSSQNSVQKIITLSVLFFFLLTVWCLLN
uniref:Preprotein-translocase subunit g n=1 Tax=Polysiphonia sertularioides TaxID=945028 RepID=A0A1Z1MG98_9FLOR|nr:preprotein-translocase subunit g [Polysiphonia sertularioides]